MRKSILLLLAVFLSLSTFAAEKEINWGYSTKSVDGVLGMEAGAIYVPAEVAQLYKGCQLKGVVAGLYGEATTLTGFATKNLSGDSFASGTMSGARAGDNTITFDQPYTIDGEAFYVGYSYTGNTLGLGACNVVSQNGCWVKQSGSWINNASSGKTLNIRAVISGDSKVLPNDGALLTVDQNQRVELGKELTLTGKYVSMSPNFTKTYSLTVSVDGVEQKTVTVSKINVGPNTENPFSVELDPFTEVGTHEVSVTLSKFGTVDDPYMANNTLTTTVEVMKRIPVRRFVVETSTALSCGWCPAATVAMNRLYDMYPDNFIGVEVYTTGSLYAPTYSQFYFNATPTSQVNRYYFVPDATAAGNISSYMQSQGLTSHVDVSVEGLLVGTTTKRVEAKATANFINAEAPANYRWAFVLTENDVTDKEYSQTNYYAGGSHGAMDGWENLSNPTTAVPPTHVARAIYDYNGIYGSFPSSVEADVPVEYTKTLDIPDNVADVHKLNVIALLFNSLTNEIVNAAEAKVEDPTGIADVEQENNPQFILNGNSLTAVDGTQLAVYTTSGEQVAPTALKSGVYVVKTSKGGNQQTRKIVVK